MEQNKCDCKTKYCPHYKSDFEKFVEQNKEMEKRFDDVWNRTEKGVAVLDGQGWIVEESGKFLTQKDFIRNFINSEIELARKEVREEIKGVISKIRYGYEAPYEGQEDLQMQKEWKGRVELCDEIIKEITNPK